MLAALQRIGRHPPPAIMVRPEDALQSVRTAIMLGAVLPEMRVQAEALATDLADLLRIRKEIADEKDRLVRDVAALTEERQRIGLLIEERQKKQAETEKALEAERQKSLVLARQVDNLKDLIGKVEQGLDSAEPRRAVGRTRAAEDQGQPNRSGGPKRPRPARRRRSHLPPPADDYHFRLMASGSRNSGLRTAWAARKRAFPLPLGPGPRSRRPVTVGWFMPDPSAITAKS